MLAQVKAPLWTDSRAFQEVVQKRKTGLPLFYQVSSPASGAFERRRVAPPPSCYRPFLSRWRPGRPLHITPAYPAKAAAVRYSVAALPAGHTYSVASSPDNAAARSSAMPRSKPCWKRPAPCPQYRPLAVPQSPGLCRCPVWRSVRRLPSGLTARRWKRETPGYWTWIPPLPAPGYPGVSACDSTPAVGVTERPQNHPYQPPLADNLSATAARRR